ncbi:MAG: SPOR domain-containing protein [Pseudomonadota bacterium]
MAKRRRARSNQKKPAPLPGWIWMLAGLAMGLSVAFAVYRYKPPVAEPTVATAAKPAAKPATPAASVAADDQAAANGNKPSEPDNGRFDFYEELPRYELIVPEVDIDVDRSAPAEPIDKPGVYEIQAGSFGRFADADRRRAEIALLGIESRVQPVTIDDRTYHRVRIGPINDTQKLNRLRTQLAAADIETATIRIGG